MKFSEIHRDLFTVNNQKTREPYGLVHCVSADFGMYSGIVVGFNQRWNMKERLLEEYGDQQINFKKYGGLVCPMKVGHVEEAHDRRNIWHIFNEPSYWIYNLVTKQKVSHKPTYGSLEQSLRKLQEFMYQHDEYKIAMPTIGCGIDGLEWVKVRGIIQKVFNDTPVEILVCRR